MRDEERIRMYYDFGTMDWRSERVQGNKKTRKTGGGYSAVRFLKMAALLWGLVFRYLSPDEKKLGVGDPSQRARKG